MKALSIHPHWAAEIVFLSKTVEVRTRKTSYRGGLLVCSTKRNSSADPEYAAGCAMCVVNLKDAVPFEEKHLKKARTDESFLREAGGGRYYARIFDDVMFIEPFPVKGRLSLFDVNDGLVKFLKFKGAEKPYYETIFKNFI